MQRYKESKEFYYDYQQKLFLWKNHISINKKVIADFVKSVSQKEVFHKKTLTGYAIVSPSMKFAFDKENRKMHVTFCIFINKLSNPINTFSFKNYNNR